MKPVESGPQVESGIGQLVASRRVPLRGKDSGRTPEPLHVVQCVDGIASSLHWGGAAGSFEVGDIGGAIHRWMCGAPRRWNSSFQL